MRAVERPCPRLARIVFHAPEFAGFPDEEPGEILTFVWPADGRAEAVLPDDDGSYPRGTPEQHARNFTIRSYDRALREIAVDFVLHGDRGRASAWALRARPGDRLAFAGPRAHFFADPDAAWTLMAGDETALPSIAATLERAPAGHRVLALVEVRDASERQEVETRADATITWIERGRQAPHRSRALVDRVRSLELPDGPGKVWVAGEASVVRALRVHLRDERGLPIGPRQAIGYWKHRETPDDVESDV